MRQRRVLSLAAFCSTSLLVCLPVPRSQAQTAPQPVDLSLDIDVIARRLDAAREQIQPSLGASVYGFSPQALQAIPQGDNAR